MLIKKISNLLIIVALFLYQLGFELTYAQTIAGFDPTGQNCNTYLNLPNGKIITIPNGKIIDIAITSDCNLIRKGEFGWDHFPVQKKVAIKISLKPAAIKPEFLASIGILTSKSRRIILNNVPASSIWHYPMGTPLLTSQLKQKGHEVLQRFGHIIGVEYLLEKYGGESVTQAINTVKNEHSTIIELYRARKLFENISKGIPTPDIFSVERSNVRYVSAKYDGTISSAIKAVDNPITHLFYSYFMDIELPLAQNFKPDIYGISVGDERQFMQGIILGSLIKKHLPHTLVVLGGNFWPRITSVFFQPEFPELFQKICDAIVYGEGFQPISQIAESLQPLQASGTVWLDHDKIIVNPLTASPTKFESLLLPDFDGGATQWAPERVYSLYTMSNCPMQCNFCAISGGSDTFLQKPRIMSPMKIAQQMAALGTHRFDIYDETFPIHTQLALGKALHEIGYQAEWHCYMTVSNRFTNLELCHQLYEAGCRGVYIGLETLSDETLGRENKKWNHPENYVKILTNLKKAGIQTHIFLLIGLPGEPLNWGLRWVPFLEQYGDLILTIKHGRFRLIKKSPQETMAEYSKLIQIAPDTKPLHLNRDFQYLHTSGKRIFALRDVIEQSCREHWAFEVTSTLPWCQNRGKYTWNELKQMSLQLPQGIDDLNLKKSFPKISSLIHDELGEKVKFTSFDDIKKYTTKLI